MNCVPRGPRRRCRIRTAVGRAATTGHLRANMDLAIRSPDWGRVRGAGGVAAEARRQAKIAGMASPTMVEARSGHPRTKEIKDTMRAAAEVKVVIGQRDDGQVAMNECFREGVGSVASRVPGRSDRCGHRRHDIVSIGGRSLSGRFDAPLGDDGCQGPRTPKLIGECQEGGGAAPPRRQVDRLPLRWAVLGTPAQPQIPISRIGERRPRLGEGELAVTTDNDMHIRSQRRRRSRGVVGASHAADGRIRAR